MDLKCIKSRIRTVRHRFDFSLSMANMALCIDFSQINMKNNTAHLTWGDHGQITYINTNRIICMLLYVTVNCTNGNTIAIIMSHI